MQQQDQPNNLSANDQEELDRLRKEILDLKAQLKKLELELKHENMGHEAYKLMVELAEETYGIEILKTQEPSNQPFNRDVAP